MATVLRDAGWSTFWVGKNHNIAGRRVDDGLVEEALAARPGLRPLLRLHRRRDRTSGIPTSPRTTTTSTSRTCPRTATTCPRTSPTRRSSSSATRKQSEPDKPWYLWFCPGANHAPHHAPQEFIDKYKGKFDDGYEAYREWVLPRMIERGILPEGTELTPINPMTAGHVQRRATRVRPWDTLSRRGEGAVLRAWPRCTPASPSTPTPRSAGSSTTSRSRGSSTTR